MTNWAARATGQATTASLAGAALQPRKRAGTQTLAAYALLGPGIVLMFVLLIGPLMSVFALSFTDYQLGERTIAFIGMRNFQALVGDPVFWKALGNTALYVCIVVPGSVALGLGAALLIESGTALRSLYRVLLFLPVMATLIAMAIVWEFMLHPIFGLVNAMLKSLGFAPQNWLQDGSLAFRRLRSSASGSNSDSTWCCSSPASSRFRNTCMKPPPSTASRTHGSASAWSPGRCWGRSRCS